MKIFKILLIGLYALSVLGSFQTYSSQYNGQEVLSIIGIVDNFLITAILPLLVYGVGLLIRKIYLKNSVTVPPTTSETLETPPSGSPELKNSIRVWQVALPVLIILIVISVYQGFSGEDVPMPIPAPSNNSAQINDDSWIPSGFSEYSEDDNIAWRWGTNSETNCTYDSGYCWSVMVITRDGCPSGIYSEIAILDRSEVQIDFTNDSTTRVLPNTKIKLTFDTYNDDADTARVGEISCR